MIDDNGNVSISSVLYLSATFDKVDHSRGSKATFVRGLKQYVTVERPLYLLL